MNPVFLEQHYVGPDKLSHAVRPPLLLGHEPPGVSLLAEYVASFYFTQKALFSPVCDFVFYSAVSSCPRHDHRLWILCSRIYSLVLTHHGLIFEASSYQHATPLGSHLHICHGSIHNQQLRSLHSLGSLSSALPRRAEPHFPTSVTRVLVLAKTIGFSGSLVILKDDLHFVGCQI